MVVAVQAVRHLVAGHGGAHVARHGSGDDAGGEEDGGGDGQRLVRVGGRMERRDAVTADTFILKVRSMVITSEIISVYGVFCSAFNSTSKYLKMAHESRYI